MPPIKAGEYMSIKITFYTFDKKPNSTKQPGNNGADFMCNLIEPTNILTPEISINIGYTANPTSYNYAFMQDFNRYYFVTNWAYNRGLWIATMSVDVLASWKTDIGNSDKYILRSASKSNGNIMDSTYPTTSKIYYDTLELGNPWKYSDYTSGVYVLGIIGGCAGGDAGKTGSVKYWAFTYSQLEYFVAYLMGGDEWYNTGPDIITDISAGLGKMMFNPLEYVVSCKWYPIDISMLDTTLQNIMPFGRWGVSINCYAINSCVVGLGGNRKPITKHPQSKNRDYLNYKPFTMRTVIYPPFGAFEIDGAFSQYEIVTQVNIDITTGDAVLRMNAFKNDNEFCALPNRQAKIGVDIPLSQMAIDFQKAISDTLGVVTNVVSGNYLGAMGGAISAITDFSKPNLENGTTANGSFLPLKEMPRILSLFYFVADEDNDERGRPLCAIEKISTLSGYVQCADGDIISNCTITERNEISSYLKGGFFYE